jgi:hypothetical protein
MLVGEYAPGGFLPPVAGIFAASAHMMRISAMPHLRYRDESMPGTIEGISYT